jgi:uncharacterized protein (TIGR00369 family)
MPIIEAVGGSITRYGVDGEDLGWAEGTFTPTPLSANPHGTVQAGVHSVLLDALMNFAINSALPGRDRTQATIDMNTELMRPAPVGAHFMMRGEVVRLARRVAHAEARILNSAGEIVSRATGTFAVYRDETAS